MRVNQKKEKNDLSRNKGQRVSSKKISHNCLFNNLTQLQVYKDEAIIQSPITAEQSSLPLPKIERKKEKEESIELQFPTDSGIELQLPVGKFNINSINTFFSDLYSFLLF